MTNSLKQVFTAAALIAAGIATLTGATPAFAKGGKEFFVQDYSFKRPMHGYSGQSGNYYCDYQRHPQRQCDANGRCRIVGWTLKQMCQ